MKKSPTTTVPQKTTPKVESKTETKPAVKTATVLAEVQPWQQTQMEVDVQQRERQLLELKRKISQIESYESEVAEKKKVHDERVGLTATVRHNLVAPPNALYNDEVICAFMFCPVCVTVGGGEFASMQEARDHRLVRKVH